MREATDDPSGLSARTNVCDADSLPRFFRARVRVASFLFPFTHGRAMASVAASAVATAARTITIDVVSDIV